MRVGDVQQRDVAERRHVVELGRGLRCASAAGAALPPAAAASARSRRNSRRCNSTGSPARRDRAAGATRSLICSGGERARVAEARHLRAQVVGLGVVDLAVDVALHLGAVAAHLAEAQQARARACRTRLPAARAGGSCSSCRRRRRRRGSVHCRPRPFCAMRSPRFQSPIRLPSGKAMVFIWSASSCLRERGGRPVVALGAHALHAVLHHAVHRRLAARAGSRACSDRSVDVAREVWRRRAPRRSGAAGASKSRTSAPSSLGPRAAVGLAGRR